MPIPWFGSGGTGSVPVVSVEIAFDTPPFSASPNWTDVSDFVIASSGISIDRGGSEGNQPGPGSCVFYLRNSDRRFTPGYVGGPYGSYIIPRRKVRITVTFGGTDYRRFTGYVQSWTQTWPGGVTESSTVRVVATDLLGILANTPLRHSVTETQIETAPAALYPLRERGAPAFDASDADQPALRRMSRRAGGTIDFGHRDGHFPSDENMRTLYIKNGGSDLDGTWSAISGVVTHGGTTTVGYGVWIRWDAELPDGTIVLASLGIDATYSLCLVMSNGGDVYAQVFDLNSTVKATATCRDTIADGRWHYVFLLYTESGSGVAKISIDNGAQASSSAIGAGYPTISQSGQLTIGGGYDGATKYLGATLRAWFSHAAVWADSAATGVSASALWEDGRRDQSPTSRSSDRLTWLLDVVNFPSPDRLIEPGCSDIATTAPDHSSALAYAQSLAEGEMGRFYATRHGYAAFNSRAHRWNTSTSWSFTWHDPEETFTEDVDSVSNIAEVPYTRQGGGRVRVADASSRAAYGHRTTSLGTEVLDAEVAHGLARHLIAWKAHPLVRADSFTWDLLTNDSDSDNAAALGLDIDDRFTLDLLPSNAPVGALDVWVEGVSELISRDAWSMTYRCSPQVDVMPNGAWVLGTSRLGVDNYLGF